MEQRLSSVTYVIEKETQSLNARIQALGQRRLAAARYKVLLLLIQCQWKMAFWETDVAVSSRSESVAVLSLLLVTPVLYLKRALHETPVGVISTMIQYLIGYEMHNSYWTRRVRASNIALVVLTVLGFITYSNT